ncbi:hypothetical protein SAMN05444274_103445 [Mariniphaga anaerophila]|uniref:Uncharacterized protein n=1 Tax=Mariniphaga anaerophila TaxID=1484053 RepID=A0A1M4YS97_9BACT|nr:hypothetical protein [Mariniphaga anaerophila]SHF08487.1 hypothetical protein SAMN05444274_103445 [Mariniphaga anaerophila]
MSRILFIIQVMAVLLPGIVKSQVIETIVVYDTIFVYDTVYEVFDATIKMERLVPVDAEIKPELEFFHLKTATFLKNSISSTETKSTDVNFEKGNMNTKTNEKTTGRKKRSAGALKTSNRKRRGVPRIVKYYAAAFAISATPMHPTSANAQNKEPDRHKTEIREITKKTPGQISFVYPLGISGKSSSETAYNISLNVLAGVSGGINGAEFGGITNINTVNMNGAQFAGINNLNLGTVRGAQFAGINNTARGEVQAAQFAGIANVAAETLKGAQFAGILNYAGIFSGAQIGVVNVARKSNGFQLGVVNYVDSLESGFSFGLLNIHKKGFYDEFELTFADYANTALSYKIGHKKFYTIFTAGKNYLKDELYFFGMGFGHIKEISSRFWLQPELISLNYFPDDFKNTEYNSTNQIKLGLRYNFSNRVAVSFAPGIYANIKDLTKGEPYESSVIKPISVIEGTENNIELGVGFSLGLILY